MIHTLLAAPNSRLGLEQQIYETFQLLNDPSVAFIHIAV
jgi:hypothetical protein